MTPVEWSRVSREFNEAGKRQTETKNKAITKAPRWNRENNGIPQRRRKLENTKEEGVIKQWAFFRAFVLPCFRDG